MSKKIIALFLSLMLVFGVMLTLASCGSTVEPTTECTEHKDENGDGICDTEGCGATVEAAAPTDDYFNENGELYLFKNGSPTFQFVLANDALSKHRGTVEELITTLNGLCEGEIKMATATEEATDVEILIGTISNRGEEYLVDKHDFGMNGYMVKQIGSKILVIGGSDKAITSALGHLKTNVFGIKRNNESFTDFVMAQSTNYYNVQTGYKITEITVDGTSLKEYAITYSSNDKTAKNIAIALQDKLYVDTGIWCDTELANKYTGKQILIRTLENDGEGGGFYANVTDGNLVIECEYEDLFEGYFEDFINEYIFTKKNKVSFAANFKFEPDYRTITYEQFGAIGTDLLDDFKAIKAAHDMANKYLLKVYAAQDATYYIRKVNDGDTVSVKTDTYWGTAKFVIVDADIEVEDYKVRQANIFNISTDNEGFKYYAEGSHHINQVLAEINANGGIKRDEFTSFDLQLGRAALVYLVDVDHKNYVRFGSNKDDGQTQREFVYLNADGTIASDTGLLYDYAKVSYVEIYYVDDRPITIDGGVFTTIANTLPCQYTYYTYRGIEISRSNTTVKNLQHYITGEGDRGAPYANFFAISRCSDVTIQDCILTAHKAYGLEGATDGNTMGTYDLSPSDCNRLLVLRVVQSNFYEEDGVTTTKIGAGGFWGIMGSNRCKNLTFRDSTLSRFDAHQGTLNASIINSNVGSITIIGGGEFKLIGSKVYSQNSNLITLREDYGSIWNGTMLIKDTEMIVSKNYASNSVNLVWAYWNETELNAPGNKSTSTGAHDFGYDCYMPKEIIVDNFSVSSANVTSVYLIGGSAYSTQVGNTVNKHYVPEYYEVKNNTKKYNFVDPRKYYKDLVFVIDGVEQP